MSAERNDDEVASPTRSLVIGERKNVSHIFNCFCCARVEGKDRTAALGRSLESEAVVEQHPTANIIPSNEAWTERLDRSIDHVTRVAAQAPAED